MYPTRRRAVLLSLVTFLGMGAALACGPWFPESILDNPGAPLRTPITSFEAEVRLVPPPSPPPAIAPPVLNLSSDVFNPVEIGSSTAQEVEELRTILRDLPPDRRDALIAAYTAFRDTQFLPMPPPRTDPAPAQPPFTPVALTELPHDIRLYLDGVSLYRLRDIPAAMAKWQEILALPADQRRYRSTWAAWMIARTLRDEKDCSAAIPYYELCSQLSAEGFADPLRLGFSSLGWQAWCERRLGHFRRAVELYYHQAIAGDPGAWSSLRQILPGFDQVDIDSLASDPFLRGLVTARLLTDTFSWYQPSTSEPPLSEETGAKHWLNALEKAKITDLAEAARFAELAYSDGKFDLAKRWLARAPDRDSRALWIKGKLALMEGRTADAERFLTAAASAHSWRPGDGSSIDSEGLLRNVPSETLANYRISQLYGDLGAANMARNHFDDALSAFQRGAFFVDSAYLAERVLTAPELMRYTDAQFPDPTGDWKNDGWYSAERPTLSSRSRHISSLTRYLLARRLARLGYFADARRYYPDNLLPIFDRYVSLRRNGKGLRHATRAERAASLWEAAQLHRTLGMNLFGTEGYPDNFADRGAFEASSYLHRRLGLPIPEGESDYDDPPDSPIAQRLIPAPTATERSRVLRSIMPFEKRYHYRYVAADLAWKASLLMPDNSEDTARALAIAGSWIERRDPQAADRFYKAMIWRNWSTPLAREADKRRWFPQVEWTYDPFADAGVPRPEGLE